MTAVPVQNQSYRLRQFLTLTFALVQRDIAARYRRSILGPLWAILQPLALMVVFNLLHVVVEIPSDGMPYLIFSYAALVPWTFFQTTVTRGATSINANAAIIKKMAVPREIFPLVAMLSALFDMSMSGLILLGMMLIFGVPLTGAVLWLPILILITALLGWGIAIGVASLATFKQDFVYATDFLLRLWLYATPVIYPLSSVPTEWYNLYILNPVVGLILGFRAILVEGKQPDTSLLAISIIITVVLCALTVPFFRFMSRYFADVL
jgi:lipopolysaccharide transport system permease protein